jgi:hypothetical protein
LLAFGAVEDAAAALSINGAEAEESVTIVVFDVVDGVAFACMLARGIE